MAKNSVLSITNRILARNCSFAGQGLGKWPSLNFVRFIETQARKKESSKSMPQANVNWDLYAAVCLERKPVITRALTELEKNFAEMLSAVEVEASLKSDHEKRHEMDLKRAERLRKGSTNEADLEQAALQTAQDFEDASLDEFNKFKPALRITKADETNNQRSLDRMLDRHLLLVVSQKIGKNKQWVLPQVLWNSGETLRQTAERALAAVGSGSKTRFMGNAPSGFHRIKYPASLRKDENSPVGAKIFFYKAHLLDLNMKFEEKAEFLWLGRSELQKYLQPEYLHSVQQFLIDED